MPTETKHKSPIALCHDDPVPGKPGYVTQRERRTCEILAELNQRLAEDGLTPDEYGFTARRDQLWPCHKVAWVACYAVTGGSEGHYIHLDVIMRDDTRVLMSLGKTFEGMDRALQIANACAIHLGA